MKYLLAAEADRIQDLLFRSSRLREVVGGSQLLNRFCEDMPSLLGVSKEDVITSGGGSFYVEFESEEAARRFGAALAEAYNRATGGTLSVAEPVEVTAGYGSASKEAGERLRRAKRRGPAVMTRHIPYIAFCESCGVGLAVAHETRVEEEEGRAFYLCPSCRAKAAERAEKSLGRFLKPFYKADEKQARALSRKMDDVLREALAEPIRLFMNNPAAKRRPRFIPALPLILGGDDLFALVPAPWALDIARHLCATFQSEMTKFAQEHGITREITMTAAVVFCKANYPYYLAHDIGEDRLSETKRMVKALARTGTHLSAVDFEIVLGSQIAPQAPTGERRPTLRPYWVTDGAVPSGWGLSINALLEWRYRLAQVPSRRLSQLRALFNRAPQDDDRERWGRDLHRLLKRVERDWGRVELEEWYSVERESDEEFWHGHALPDLLRVWDWALKLDIAPVEYEGGGR